MASLRYWVQYTLGGKWKVLKGDKWELEYRTGDREAWVNATTGGFFSIHDYSAEAVQERHDLWQEEQQRQQPQHQEAESNNTNDMDDDNKDNTDNNNNKRAGGSTADDSTEPAVKKPRV